MAGLTNNKCKMLVNEERDKRPVPASSVEVGVLDAGLDARCGWTAGFTAELTALDVATL